MIEVEYNRGTDDRPDWGVYRYQRNESKAYWLGVRPVPGYTNYPRPNVVVPVHMWNDLTKAAIDDGADPSDFRTKKKEKKPAAKRAKKNPGISIF
tara:strand:+ start:253 stop:537 length:285 start_codon:yes stop_codon:yes gene_type:complete